MFQSLRKHIIFPQWCAGIGVILLLIQLGLMGGWSSPTLARLIGKDSAVPMSVEQASWIASLINVGRFFGAIAGSFSLNYLGSKRSIFVTSLPIVFSWSIIALANSAEILYLGRLVAGIGMGMIFCTYAIYLGEISMSETRGALISFAAIGAPLGQLLASVASSRLSLTASSCIYAGCALVLSSIFLWLPESPHHLIKVQDRVAAEKSIDWYRAGIEVKKELEEVEKFVNNSLTSSFKNKLQEFRKPVFRKALIHVICLYSLQQICGLNTILFYMEIILVKANFNLFDPSLVFVYSNVGCVFSAIVSMILIDKCGRKFLLVLSSALVTLSCLGLAVYFLFIDMNVNMEKYQWIPLISMITYVVSYAIGLFPVPSALLSEIFPANIKSIASCIASLAGAVSAFITAKTYEPLTNLIGDTYIFLVYAIITALAIPYTLLLVPETKGKSFQQIQDKITKA